MKYKISLKGRTYEVEVERGEAMILNEYDSLAPAPAVSAAPGTAVKAPLPGNVLSVNVNLGDAVKAGQLLVLIEAMKMENEVFAPSDGVVKQILAPKGAVVSTGDTLLVI